MGLEMIVKLELKKEKEEKKRMDELMIWGLMVKFYVYDREESLGMFISPTFKNWRDLLTFLFSFSPSSNERQERTT